MKITWCIKVPQHHAWSIVSAWSMCTRLVMKATIMFFPFSRSYRQNRISKANFLTSSFPPFRVTCPLPLLWAGGTPSINTGCNSPLRPLPGWMITLRTHICFCAGWHVFLALGVFQWRTKIRPLCEHRDNNENKTTFWKALRSFILPEWPLFSFFFLTQSTRAHFIQPVAEWVGVKMPYKQKR